MPATTNKQQLLNQVFTALKKKYGEPAEPEKRTVLEHLLYAVCREGTTREVAAHFHDVKPEMHVRVHFDHNHHAREVSIMEHHQGKKNNK